MKLLSLLLALVMAFGMTTVMASAASSDVTLGSGRNGVTIQFGTPASYKQGLQPDYETAEKIVGETGSFQRLPIFGNPNSLLANPKYWAIPKTGSVTVSEEGIIDNFKFTLGSWAGAEYNGATCLQFNYKAIKAGTVTVTLKYYYNFNLTSAPSWYGETATFTVNVKEDDVEIDPATKPAQPSNANSDFDALYEDGYGVVFMECSDNWNSHRGKAESLDKAENGYSVGEVKENDGSVSDAPKSKWPWMCEMTIHVNAWLDLYNKNFAEAQGMHRLSEGSDKDFVIKWFWNKDTESWGYKEEDHTKEGFIDLWLTCANAPAATEYTVTYTDGVDGAAFTDQVYTVKDGDATPAFDGTPAREGYVFLGWEPEVAETVTGNATYTAQWEEALTEVKVTSNRKEGALLFLGDELKVTAKANTAATITITPTLNGAFKQIASDTAADGTKTIWYRVTKIIGNYTTLNFKATATKGTQEPVTGELTYGVNLRNRIHVTVKMASGTVVENASIRLMHKYPQWNACPALKYDSAKGEYVMANEWDLSSQEFWQVEIKVGDDTFYIDTDKFGKNLLDVVRTGEEEIYVEYVIVDPITVNFYVNGVNAGSKEYKGSMNQVLDYSAFQTEMLTPYIGTMNGLKTEGLNGDNCAVFGSCTEVNIHVTTK